MPYSINGTCLFHAVFWLSFFLHGTCHCCFRVNLQRTYHSVFFLFNLLVFIWKKQGNLL